MPPRLWTPGTCRRCRGRGYIPHPGEAMAADPCDCDEPVVAGPDPDDERDKRIDDELMGLNDPDPPDFFGDD